MGASFSGNFFGGSYNRSYSNMMTQQTTSIKETCTGDQQKVSYDEDISITLEGVSCEDINVFVEQVNFNTACATDISQNVTVTNMAQQLAGLVNKGGISGKVNVFGAAVNVNQSNIQTQLTNNLEAACSQEQDAISKVNGATIKVEHVSCENMNVFQNNSSIQAQCHMKVTQDTYASNAAIQKAGEADTGIFSQLFATIPGILISLAVIGGIVAIIIYLLHSSNVSARAANAAHYIQHRTIPAGANPAVTRLDAQHAMWSRGASAAAPVMPQQIATSMMGQTAMSGPAGSMMPPPLVAAV